PLVVCSASRTGAFIYIWLMVTRAALDGIPAHIVQTQRLGLVRSPWHATCLYVCRRAAETFGTARTRRMKGDQDLEYDHRDPNRPSTSRGLTRISLATLAPCGTRSVAS